MTNASVPLLRGDPAAPVLLRTDGSAIDRATLLRQIHALAAQLPDAPSVINVCESRHHFLVALCAAAVTDAATEGNDAGQAAGGEQGGKQETNRGGPVVYWRQDDTVRDQHQIKCRHEAMNVAPEMVGKTTPEGDYDHRQQEIKSPFTEGFCRLA